MSMTLYGPPCKIAPMNASSFQKKISEIEKIFALLTTEQKYNAIIQLGRTLPPFPEELKKTEHVVSGCQSTLYLASEYRDGKLFFQAHSDALISSGLAAILLKAYSGESPETILTSPPNFLIDLAILSSLSPSRSNGLAHIHLKMKQEALKALRLEALNKA
jgi:cysteine desulfuration protein SufE